MTPLCSEAVTHVINLSIESKTFPATWKPLLIFPTHKKGPKTDGRPVAHINELGKLCEYAVNEQLVELMTQNDLWHDSHHRGLQHHSIETAHLTLRNQLLNSETKDLLSGILMIGQKAAFDIIDHNIVTMKMKAYKCQEEAISWFKSYLSSRHHRSRVQSKDSQDMGTGENDILQGSVLGLTLYLEGEP